MKSTALPSWCYRNPELIADGLIALSAKHKKAEEKRARIAADYRLYGRMRKARKVRALVKKAKNGGFK